MELGRAPRDVTRGLRDPEQIISRVEESSNRRRSRLGDQPINSLRLRLQWLNRHAQVVALWSASFALLSLAGFVALGWL